MLTRVVEALCTGQPAPFRGEEPSAFVKSPASGPVRITREGLEGDVQVDRKNHGGVHMAVHLYPRSHRAFWRETIGASDLLDDPGAFGTNIAIDGLDENDVMLGDRFRLGTALLEISQPRMPCWKIDHRFGRKGMVATIIQTGRCGWYFRVIEEGAAQPGDMLELVETGRTPWTVRRVFSAIANPKTAVASAELTAMARCPLLSPDWQEKARKKAQSIATG